MRTVTMTLRTRTRSYSIRNSTKSGETSSLTIGKSRSKAPASTLAKKTRSIKTVDKKTVLRKKLAKTGVAGAGQQPKLATISISNDAGDDLTPQQHKEWDTIKHQFKEFNRSILFSDSDIILICKQRVIHKKTWNEIASLPTFIERGLTSIQIKDRFFQMKRTKGGTKVSARICQPWSDAEVLALRERVTNYGKINWDIVGKCSLLRNRSREQMKSKWKDLKKKENEKQKTRSKLFTVEQDAVICKQKLIHKKTWNDIASLSTFMECGLTSKQIKGRFEQIKRMKNRVVNGSHSKSSRKDSLPIHQRACKEQAQKRITPRTSPGAVRPRKKVAVTKKTSSRAHRVCQLWSDAEIFALKKHVKKHGTDNWNMVDKRSKLRNRSPEQMASKWSNLKNQNNKEKLRVRWSKEEVRALTKQVKKHGMANWDLVKSHPKLLNRSLAQLRAKWSYMNKKPQLQTSVVTIDKSRAPVRRGTSSKGGKTGIQSTRNKVAQRELTLANPKRWTKREVKTLKEQVKKYGTERRCWDMIANHPNLLQRSKNQIYMKWNYIMKQQIRLVPEARGVEEQNNQSRNMLINDQANVSTGVDGSDALTHGNDVTDESGLEKATSPHSNTTDKKSICDSTSTHRDSSCTVTDSNVVDGNTTAAEPAPTATTTASHSVLPQSNSLQDSSLSNTGENNDANSDQDVLWGVMGMEASI